MSITLRHPVPGAPRGSRYGPRSPFWAGGKWTRSMHSGQDFPADSGTPIVAAADGTVGYAGWVTTGGGSWTRIDHAGNFKTHYGHQSRIIVRGGQRVKAGQVIGYVGTTGSSTGNHLHFELSLGSVRRDPWPYITTASGGAVNETLIERVDDDMFMIYTDAYGKGRWALIGSAFVVTTERQNVANALHAAIGGETKPTARLDKTTFDVIVGAAKAGQPK